MVRSSKVWDYQRLVTFPQVLCLSSSLPPSIHIPDCVAFSSSSYLSRSSSLPQSLSYSSLLSPAWSVSLSFSMYLPIYFCVPLSRSGFTCPSPQYTECHNLLALQKIRKHSKNPAQIEPKLNLCLPSSPPQKKISLDNTE